MFTIKKSVLLLFFDCLVISHTLSDEGTTGRSNTPFPIGSVHNCPTTQFNSPTKPLLQMNVLPGFGFDNLRNIDLGRVYDHSNFSTCQTSGDGIYLIPDAINLIPIMESQADLISEVFDDTSQWKSDTAYSVNVAASANWGVAHISAKFSMDYQTTKTKMVNDQSRSTRIGIRHRLYSVDINPDSKLHPSFKSRIFEIAANIMNDNTKVAHYLSEMLVRDYGTHVLTGIDAGAILSQTTMFQGTFKTTGSSDHLAIKAAASASYLSKFKVSAETSDSKTDQQKESFESNSTSSYTKTHGGPPFKLGGTYEEWQAGILDHLVAVDRRGEPLHTVLSTDNVPELPPITLMDVSNYIEKAIVRYYKINTISGCMTYKPPGPLPENFNFHANIDNHKCEEQKINYTFGGVFQTCENSNVKYKDVCKDNHLTQVNPLTKGMSCPTGYIEVPLHKGVYSAGEHKRKRIFHHTKYYPLDGTYTAYWCALIPYATDTDPGLLFGGVYTSKTANIVTGKQACPPSFFPLRIAMDINVCVSSDTTAFSDSWNFGGFYSCSSGNPLASSKTQYENGIHPKDCPIHYNQMMMEVDEDCIINYCADIRQRLTFEPRSPHLPPFNKKILLSQNASEEVLLLTDIEGNTWAKTADGIWEKVVKPDSITTGQQLLNEMQITNATADHSNNKGQHRLSNGQIAGIVIATAVGTVSILLVLWVVGRGIKKQKNKRTTYGNIDLENRAI